MQLHMFLLLQWLLGNSDKFYGLPLLKSNILYPMFWKIVLLLFDFNYAFLFFAPLSSSHPSLLFYILY